MKTGQIITFYSYKGGVGRTMALANIATMLSHWGYRVLMIDWDLEAPGLENYFRKFSSIDVEAIAQRKGLIDLLNPDEDDKKLKPADITLTIKTNISKTPLHLITAGRRDENYYQKVRSFDIDKFYEEKDGYQKIEDLRNNWKAAYDFVLIDSRTGVTDIGGVCTIQMPDSLVMLFTPTEIGFTGVLDVAQRALAAQQKLAHARYRLTILPIPTRIDSNEFELMQEWMSRFSYELKDIYKAWLPTSVSSRDILDVTKVPHVPYFSYGEKLPVIEQRTTDATGLRYAYENISALIANQFAHVEQLINDRAIFLQKANLNGNGNRKKVEEVAPSRNAITPKKVFLSYAAEDMSHAIRIYEALTSKGIDVWFDQDAVLPGQNWQAEIAKAIRESDFFILLISKRYSKPEVTEAIEEQVKRRKKGEVFILPVRLDYSNTKFSEINNLNSLYLFPESKYEERLKKLIQAIESA